jgi:hypothetical protein
MDLELFTSLFLVQINLPALSNILMVTSSSLPPIQRFEDEVAGLGLRRISSELNTVSS